jgi:hypothetical protein
MDNQPTLEGIDRRAHLDYGNPNKKTCDSYSPGLES